LLLQYGWFDWLRLNLKPGQKSLNGPIFRIFGLGGLSQRAAQGLTIAHGLHPNHDPAWLGMHQLGLELHGCRAP
jgi:hypothetical protein